MRNHVPQGGGAVGFGCGFLLTFAAAFGVWLPMRGSDFAITFIIAVVGGLLGAKFGDRFFEALGWFRRW